MTGPAAARFSHLRLACRARTNGRALLVARCFCMNATYGHSGFLPAQHGALLTQGEACHAVCLATCAGVWCNRLEIYVVTDPTLR